MVSGSSFKSSSIQRDVHFLNYGPISSQINDKPAYALRRGYLQHLVEHLVLQKDTKMSRLLVSKSCFKPFFLIKMTVNVN